MSSALERTGGWSRRFWRLAAFAAMVPVAALATIFALASVLVRDNAPRAAGLLAMQSNAQASIADDLLMAAQKQNGTQARQTLASAAEHARAAITQEPSNPRALRALAFLADMKAIDANAKGLMDLSTGYSSRDLAAQMWMMEHSARNDDAERYVKHADIALRTKPRGYDAILPAFVTTLQVDDVVPHLARRMRPGVPWSTAFWFEVSRQPIAWPNGVRLLRLLAGSASVPERAVINEWVGNMVARREFDLAARTVDVFVPRAPVIRQGFSTKTFGEDVSIAPFGWQFTQSGDISATGASDGGLVMNVVRGGGGLIARRLMALRPGTFRISGTLKAEPGAESELPQLAVYCADTPAAVDRLAFRSLPSAAGSYAASGTISIHAGCPFQWLEIRSPSVDSIDSRSTELASLSVQFAGNGQQ